MTGAAGLLHDARVGGHHRLAIDIARHCTHSLLFLLHMKVAERGGACTQHRPGVEVTVRLGAAARNTDSHYSGY